MIQDRTLFCIIKVFGSFVKDCLQTDMRNRA